MYTPIAEGRLDCVSELNLATRIKQKQFSNEERVCCTGNVAAKEKKKKRKKQTILPSLAGLGN
jgi:hypothetical protein